MVGGTGWGSMVLIFGIWFLYASCGLFGMRGIATRLRIWSSLETFWLIFFSVLSLIGLEDGGLLIVFLSHISFTLFGLALNCCNFLVLL
jgi:hypothetical protein